MSEYVRDVNQGSFAQARARNSRYRIDGASNSDERFSSLFEPDAVVSAQYFERFRRKTLLEPEKRLMLAVLGDAIDCFQDNVLARSGKRKKLFEESEAWILAGDRDWVFSFENICEVLGINPTYLRHGLLDGKKRKLRMIGRPSSRHHFGALSILKAN
jgi:hypothetical protein